MKISHVAIGFILFAEALLLVYSPNERHSFHHFFAALSEHCQCQKLASLTYQCIQNMRFVTIAIIVSGAYSLVFGGSVIMGVIAQFLWMTFQSDIIYKQSIGQIRQFLIQFLFLIILLKDVKLCCGGCKKPTEQSKGPQSSTMIQRKLSSEDKQKKSNEKQKGQKGQKQGKKNQQKVPSSKTNNNKKNK